MAEGTGLQLPAAAAAENGSSHAGLASSSRTALVASAPSPSPTHKSRKADDAESEREAPAGLDAPQDSKISPMPLNVLSDDMRRRRKTAERPGRKRRGPSVGKWDSCRQRMLSIRGLVILVSVIQVGGAVAFSWGLTYFFGRTNVESLALTLVRDMQRSMQAEVTKHLVSARTAVLRTKADFDAGRLKQANWRSMLETFRQNLELQPALLTTYVRFTDDTFYGSERCDAALKSCPTGYWSTVNNGTFLSFYSATDRGQPVDYQFGSRFTVRAGDWYSLTMRSANNATWSDVRASANPKTDPLENLVVSFSAAIRPRDEITAVGGPVPAGIPGAAPAAAPSGWSLSSGIAGGSIAGAVGANIPVATLSRILARLAPVPETVLVLTTDGGRMVASSTMQREHILDESRSSILASASPLELARDLFAALPTEEHEGTILPSFRSGNREYFGSSADVFFEPDLNWRMYVAVPRDVVLAQITAGLTWTTVANSLWLGLCVLSAAVVSWFITRPLGELRKQILALARTMSTVTRELRMSAHAHAHPQSPVAPPPGLAEEPPPPGVKARRAWFKPASWMAGGGSVSPTPPAAGVAPTPAPANNPPNRRASGIASSAGTSDTEETGASGSASPITHSRARQSTALNTGLAELSAFESLMADVHSRFTAFQELSSTETALLKTLLAERKTKLEMEVRNEETKKFLATMSHEMRTPLNGILGMLQLAQDCDMSKDAAEYVEAAALSGEHLLSLVNDVLDLQKIEAGAIELQSVPMSVRAAAASAVRIVQQKASDKGLKLDVRLDERIPQTVAGDPDRVRQVLLNLVSNAVKYTFSGEVRLSVSLHEMAVSGIDPSCVCVMFEIEDTGPGIDSESQRQLFSRFFRVRRLPGGLPDPGGTGLGLAISREIVERAGGAIGCESTPGKGSRFWFWLPLRPLDDAAEERVPPLNSAAGVAIGPATPLPPLAAAKRSPAPAPVVLSLSSTSTERPVPPSSLGVMSNASPRGSIVAGPGPRDSTMSSSTLFREIELVRGSASASSLPPLQSARSGPSPSVGPAPPARPCTILVVEDNAVNARVLSGMLRREGHEVALAEDGQAALAAFTAAADACRENPKRLWDIIFMDCLMPVLDGYEATAAIRRLEAERGLPRHFIVALTAYATAEDEQRCLTSGMDSYMSKPLRKPLLLAKVEEYLAGRPEAGADREPPAMGLAGIAPGSGLEGLAGITPAAAARPLLRPIPAPAALDRPPKGTPPKAEEARKAPVSLSALTARIEPPPPPPERSPPASAPDLSELQIPLPVPLQRRTSTGSERQRVPPGPPLDVLVVDDIEMNRRVLTAFLASEGHRTHVATDGEEAVAAFEARAKALQAGGTPLAGPVFDTIFMDVSMPRMDGHEATKRIRALERTLAVAASSPIVACTAFNSSHDKEGVLRSGMSDFMGKPVARATLLGMLGKWTRRHSSSGSDRSPSALSIASGPESPPRRLAPLEPGDRSRRASEVE